MPIPARNHRESPAAGRDTRLGRAIAPRAAAHPGKSGFYALVEPRDAFAARAHLARTAERSLDVQCYIWRADLSGNLLFQALHDAAGRGVRVRLLLDDNNTVGLDATLAALDAHPNIEVRLFNPFRLRGQRWLGYLTDFSRLNRRMHNKSLTADNQATIIGGRNVGDEYFEAGEGMVLAVLAAFIVAPMLGVPITLLIIAACFLFPPLPGGFYALGGVLLSAAATYGVARLLGRDAVRRLAGWRLNAVTRRLAHKGVWAVAGLRLLPIASFSTVNAVAGASRIRLADLMLGTALGMAPWIVLTLTFVDRVRAVLRDPGPVSYALLAADIILILLAVFFVWRRFRAP